MTTETTESNQTYFHVAGESYEAGDDLYCWDELESLGVTIPWKFEGEPFDTDVVCLFESIDEAREFRQEWCPAGSILRVTLPEDMTIVHVSEGYPAVFGRIDSRYIEVAE